MPLLLYPLTLPRTPELTLIVIPITNLPYQNPNLRLIYVELACLFVKESRPGDSEETISVFELSCHQLLALSLTSPLKGRGILVKCLA